MTSLCSAVKNPPPLTTTHFSSEILHYAVFDNGYI